MRFGSKLPARLGHGDALKKFVVIVSCFLQLHPDIL